MEELMQMIQKVHPEVKEIILVSDNAGQFSAGENINYILSRNKVNWGSTSKSLIIAFSKLNKGRQVWTVISVTSISS